MDEENFAARDIEVYRRTGQTRNYDKATAEIDKIVFSSLTSARKMSLGPAYFPKQIGEIQNLANPKIGTIVEEQDNLAYRLTRGVLL
ncbi:hypothetical protein CEXT_665911 [Caerostris extrusa]|uniref:Uncharacterized protein n=1 Tax=Caerostris extrusa TaxID=172846 RepID=A0AAV4T6L5_CAEEX|nr:hypothetical protein CEXT_665911 [Caerostris extrusa]